MLVLFSGGCGEWQQEGAALVAVGGLTSVFRGTCLLSTLFTSSQRLQKRPLAPPPDVVTHRHHSPNTLSSHRLSPAAGRANRRPLSNTVWPNRIRAGYSAVRHNINCPDPVGSVRASNISGGTNSLITHSACYEAAQCRPSVRVEGRSSCPAVASSSPFPLSPSFSSPRSSLLFLSLG